MKLIKYAYKLIDFSGRDDWIMDEIDLQDINLIVGKNAAGKSRILVIPTAFSEMITQYKPVYFGNWDFTFITDDNIKLNYNIFKNKNKISEKLTVEEKVVLDRNDKMTSLYSEKKKDFEKINPPDNKLVLHVRRDKEEYPFLEEIVKWAEQTHGFKFGQIYLKSFLGREINDDPIVKVEDIPSLIEKLDDSFKSSIISDFNKLGYNIEDISSKFEQGQDILYIREKGFRYDTRQNQLSEGMFRTLSLIVLIQYLINENIVKTIIVDDLCEGLDYDRATKLGKLIFEKLKNKNIQFIASSNDSFLMDVVDIKYWNIIDRKDNRVRVYNYKNSKEKFDSFKYSGLSNFDLFSSDYLSK